MKLGLQNNEMLTELIKEYSFPFESVFDDEQCRNLLHTHLLECHNESPYLFIKETDNFSNILSQRNRIKRARTIVDSFVRIGANHEINLSHNVRTKLIDTIEMCMDDEAIDLRKDFFNEARTTIILELKQDNYPSFVVSQVFVNHLYERAKKDFTLLDQIGVKNTITP
ncbi:hypothetical protein AKO1_002789, partial [Acrasis kona]